MLVIVAIENSVARHSCMQGYIFSVIAFRAFIILTIYTVLTFAASFTGSFAANGLTVIASEIQGYQVDNDGTEYVSVVVEDYLPEFYMVDVDDIMAMAILAWIGQAMLDLGYYDVSGIDSLFGEFLDMPSLTPYGMADILDNFTNNMGIEFMTVVTADGNVFYLIIDRNRDSGNVYFLRTVMAEDLLPLAEDYHFEEPDVREDITNAEMLLILYELFAQGLDSADIEYMIDDMLTQDPPGEDGIPWVLIVCALAIVIVLGYVFVWPKIKQSRESRMESQLDFEDDIEMDADPMFDDGKFSTSPDEDS